MLMCSLIICHYIHEFYLQKYILTCFEIQWEACLCGKKTRKKKKDTHTYIFQNWKIPRSSAACSAKRLFIYYFVLEKHLGFNCCDPLVVSHRLLYSSSFLDSFSLFMLNSLSLPICSLSREHTWIKLIDILILLSLF